MKVSRPHVRAKPALSWAGPLLALVALAALVAACTTAPAQSTPPPTAAAGQAAPTSAEPAVTGAATATPGAPAASNAATPAATIDLSKLPSGVDANGDFYRGDPNAPVKLIEYSDFQ